MNYKCEFVDGPFGVIVRTSGEADPREFVRGRRSVMNDPRYRPGMNVLLDHTELDFSGVTADGLAEMAESSTGDDDEVGNAGYFAIVTPRPLAFGLARMWQAFLSTQFDERVVIVETVEAAYGWLEEALAAQEKSEA